MVDVKTTEADVIACYLLVYWLMLLPKHLWQMNLNIFSDLRRPGLVPGENLSPSTNINSVIEKIKVYILVSNYTNKHLTFHKGEYIGHLETAVLDPTDQKDIHHTNSVTLKKMMSETVTPDTFNPP